MKTQKIIYWICTGIFSAIMLMSAYMYIASKEAEVGFAHSGFPSFFRIELAAAKFLGALALLLPFIPARVKEWAYAGFGITLISAFITHSSIGDPASMCIMPLVLFLILTVSYVLYHRLHKVQL